MTSNLRLLPLVTSGAGDPDPSRVAGPNHRAAAHGQEIDRNPETKANDGQDPETSSAKPREDQALAVAEHRVPIPGPTYGTKC